MAGIAKQILRTTPCLTVMALLVALSGCGEGPAREANGPPAGGESLVLYSSLSHERILDVAAAYRSASGVSIDFLIDPAEPLIDVMAKKKNHPPADVLLIEGIGALSLAVELDVLRPATVDRPAGADSRAPVDPDGYWLSVGYSADAMVLAGRRETSERPGYAGLASPDFEGSLCMRRGQSDRNRGLVATLLSTGDPRDTELVVRQWRKNSAGIPIENAGSVVNALADGRCRAAILGTDSLIAHGFFAKAGEFDVYLPDEAAGGTVLHPTAAGVSRHASRPAAAKAFVAWLLTAEGQAALHRRSQEFPVNDAVKAAPEIEAMREILAVRSTPAAAAFAHGDAIRLIERAGYRASSD